MATHPYQFTAPRRTVLNSAWRFALCISLAITGLLAAAMTWTPVPAASASNVLVAFDTTSDADGIADTAAFKDLVRSHPVVVSAPKGVHATKKTVRVSRSAASTTTTTSASGGSVSAALGGLPCQQSYMFVSKISLWTTPPGCYANIYSPSRTAYHASSTFGYCNWWVEALHPNQPDILYGKEYTHSSTPVAGAAVWFNPNVQGAGSAGHWANVVAVSPDHYWVLITEMNFYWRGGGWGKVDFRYIHVGAGVVFIH
jgi:hypothetical protein